MGRSDWFSGLAMVMVQVGMAALNVLSKLAMNTGMSPFVMITYRQLVAALFLSPIAFFTERKTGMKITRKVLFQIFLCSIFGATGNQLLYFLGLKYSSPTMACALGNMLPAITFIMAVLLRMETLGLRKKSGQAKVMGTALCVGGSMLMTFYKGRLVRLGSSGIHWRYAEALSASHTPGAGDDQALGAALVVGACFAWAIWFIVQARMSESFSSPYTSTALMVAMAGAECFLVAAAVERGRWSRWALGWDIRLVASLYSGLVGSGMAFVGMSWCIQKRGALYVSMFSPLLLVIVAVLGWAVLNEKLYVGTVTGSFIIVLGLYSVLWGKGKEMKKVDAAFVAAVEENFDLHCDAPHDPHSYQRSREIAIGTS